MGRISTYSQRREAITTTDGAWLFVLGTVTALALAELAAAAWIIIGALSP